MEVLCYPKQSVHSAIKQLVCEGYMESACTLNDRRCRTLRLTARGTALAAKTADAIIDAERRAFCMLSDEEREMLLCLFERLSQSVQTEMAKAVPPADT